jgi:hypothetical protein
MMAGVIESGTGKIIRRLGFTMPLLVKPVPPMATMTLGLPALHPI